MGSGIFVEGLCKFRTHPGSVQAPTVCELTTVSPDLNKCKTSLGQRRELDVDSGVVFRGLNKHRIQLGSIQGHRCAVRSIVGILHKGSTQPDSLHGPRDGPRSIFQSFDNRCVLRSICWRLE